MSDSYTLVTGASSGIGEALARKFADRGHHLIISARREERLRALAEELGKKVDVRIIVADLGRHDGVDLLMQQLADLDVEVEMLVNNAGVASSGDFSDLSGNEIDDLIALNVKTLTRLTHALLPGMLDRRQGRILNVASVAAFQPVPSMTLYAASKAFVLSFTEALSEELRGSGVTITALCPGLTRTEMIDSFPGTNDMASLMMASAESVASAGYDAMMRAEVIRIPGMTNLAAVAWSKYQPRWLIRSLGGILSRANASTRVASNPN